MSAVAAIVAFPVAALTIWALLRNGLGGPCRSPLRRPLAQHETPSFGGVGIFLGLLAGIGACFLAGAIEPTWELAGIAGGAAIVFAFGLIDDLRSLPPPVKLAGQFAAAGIVSRRASASRSSRTASWPPPSACSGSWRSRTPSTSSTTWTASPGASPVVAAVFFAVDAVWIHDDDLLLVGLARSRLAVAGFLPFNFRPRKPAAVFMGDSGSQVIGLTLARSAWRRAGKVAESTIATLIIPLLVLAIPILDTALVTAVRLVEAAPSTRAAATTSHRLVRSGISRRAPSSC